MTKLVVLATVVLVIALVADECHRVHAKDTFSPLSNSAFSDIQCVPFAYGDFNADKRIDIFCVSGQGKKIEIWLAQEREPLFAKYLESSLM